MKRTLLTLAAAGVVAAGTLAAPVAANAFVWTIPMIAGVAAAGGLTLGAAASTTYAYPYGYTYAYPGYAYAYPYGYTYGTYATVAPNTSCRWVSQWNGFMWQNVWLCGG